jgi:hypothetical protein
VARLLRVNSSDELRTPLLAGQYPSLGAQSEPSGDLLWTPAPCPKIVRIERNAKHVGWTESKLIGPRANDTNQQALHACHDPPAPHLSANQEGGDDRE